MKRGLFYTTSSLLLLSSGGVVAQVTAAADTSARVVAASLQRHYQRVMRNEWSLYNGPQYVDYVRSNTSGHRFFGISGEQPATVTYGGTTYQNILLRYDLVREQLVLRPYQDDTQLYLVNELVERFSIGGHDFVRVPNQAPGRSHFYEVLVEGPVRLLAAHYKRYAEYTRGTAIEGEITAATDYYVLKEGSYHPIKKAKELVRLFPEHRTELRKQLQATKSAEREEAIIALARYQTTLAAPTGQ